jgi:hypothetical protein
MISDFKSLFLVFGLFCLFHGGFANTVNGQGPGDSIRVTITALNLSEDMSRLSSNNDELLFMIYEVKDSLMLDPFLLYERFIFNDSIRSKQFSFRKQKEGYTLLVILIEQDEDIPMERLDPVVRTHHADILEVFRRRDYIQIEKYLGDEDILGMEYVTLSEVNQSTLTFKGVYRLDRYHYEIFLGE